MTQPNWNPNADGKKGIELLDVGYAHSVIDASSDVGELQYRARFTGAVDDVQLFAGTGAVAPALDSRYNSLNRPMLVELIEQGDEATGTLTSEDFTVTAVTGSAGMFNENLTTPITASRLNASNDNLYLAASQLGATVEAQFGTGAFSLSRHVLRVDILARFNLTAGFRRLDPTGQPWFYNYPMFAAGMGPLVTLTMGEAIVDGTATEWSHWTPQMVRDFASGGTRKIRVSCQAGPGYWRLDRLLLRVFSVPERRRGVGIGSPTTSQAWVNFSMTTPNATGSPAVAAGEDMTLLCRRITDYNIDAVAGFTVLPWRYLRGRAPDGLWRRHNQPYVALPPGASSLGSSIGMQAAGDQIDGIPAVRMLSGGSIVADSMPYEFSRGALVHEDHGVTQTITVTGGPTVYGQCYAVVGWRPDLGRPEGPLRFEVYDSTGVRMFSLVDISAADVDRLPVTAPANNVDDRGVVYKTAKLRFPESETLAADTYEVRVTSPDTSFERTWHVAALVAGTHSVDQTFGGTTDHAEGEYFTLPGTVQTVGQLTSWSADLQVQLLEVPPAVTGVATAVGSLTAHHLELCDPNEGCEGCADDTMPFAEVTWSPSPSGNPDVVGYQIERLDDLAPDWERVAAVAGRETATWHDHEVRIGVTSRYRVRALRADDVTGDWSDETPVTIPPGQVALTFSSNAATGMGCVYPEVWTGAEVTRPFQFLEAGDVELRRIYGRDKQVAFRPSERRGDAFERTLLINALCAVPRPTMTTWDPLRDLAWAPIPYVCVRDGEGNRWYASITVPEGTGRRADSRNTELWLADIGIVEVADRPTVHDTSVAQVEAP